MRNKKNQEKNVDPTKLDQVADQKYPADFRDKTEELMASGLASQIEDQKMEDDLSAYRNDELTVSEAARLAGSTLRPEDADSDLKEEEITDLEQAANRSVEQDDFLDQEVLDNTDNEAAPLNEQNDLLAEDLDIDPEQADANLYDDNQ